MEQLENNCLPSHELTREKCGNIDGAEGIIPELFVMWACHDAKFVLKQLSPRQTNSSDC
jgi:hypothetical protein